MKGVGKLGRYIRKAFLILEPSSTHYTDNSILTVLQSVTQISAISQSLLAFYSYSLLSIILLIPSYLSYSALLLSINSLVSCIRQSDIASNLCIYQATQTLTSPP